MKLTADQLERLVLKMANQTPTRYWLHWNHPNDAPWLMAMAIDLRRENPRSVISTAGDLGNRGLELLPKRDGLGFHVFTVERDIDAERAAKP